MDPIELKNSVETIEKSIVAMAKNITNTNIVNFVTPYEGQPHLCKTWIKEVDKWATVHVLSDEAKFGALYLTARKNVSDFLSRYFKDNNNPTWENITKSLLTHFSAVTDPSHALDLLQKIKQGKDESLIAYSERIHELAQNAYSDADLGDEATQRLAQRQLAMFFIGGLASQKSRYRCLKKKCATLKDAVSVAREDEDLMRRFGARSFNSSDNRNNDNNVEVPMEVDALRRKQRCFHCNSPHHNSNNCNKRQTLAVHNHEATRQFQQQPRHQYDKQNNAQTYRTNFDHSNLICFQCGRLGHIKRNCRFASRPTQNHQPPQRQQWRQQSPTQYMHKDNNMRHNNNKENQPNQQRPRFNNRNNFNRNQQHLN